MDHSESLEHQRRHGWARFKNVVPADVVERALESIWQELAVLSPGFSKDLPLRDLVSKLPPNIHHILQNYRFGILDEVLAAKTHPNVIKVFQQLWKRKESDEMIASQDAISFMLPMIRGMKETAWPHVDQSPHRAPLLQPQGATCIQGFVVATHDIITNEAGDKVIRLISHTKELGGLRLLPDSHTKFHQVMKQLGVKKAPNDWYKFTDPDNEADKETILKKLYNPPLKDNGNIAWIEVEAEPGDLIVWDSRMVHYGMRPIAGQNAIRVALYICMMPKDLATPKQLERKWQSFKAGRQTSHWPFGGRMFQQFPRIRGEAERVKVEAINKRFQTGRMPHVSNYRLFAAPYTTGDQDLKEDEEVEIL